MSAAGWPGTFPAARRQRCGEVGSHVAFACSLIANGANNSASLAEELSRLGTPDGRSVTGGVEALRPGTLI
jgi:hypothetical protein